jgi:hypothetical protein
MGSWDTRTAHGRRWPARRRARQRGVSLMCSWLTSSVRDRAVYQATAHCQQGRSLPPKDRLPICSSTYRDRTAGEGTLGCCKTVREEVIAKSTTTHPFDHIHNTIKSVPTTPSRARCRPAVRMLRPGVLWCCEAVASHTMVRSRSSVRRKYNALQAKRAGRYLVWKD